MASIVRVGNEQRVNTTIVNYQERSSVTELGDGGWLVTWTSVGQDGNGNGVYQQRYNADGSTRGVEQQVNTHTTGHQMLPSVTLLPDGEWLVTWISAGQDGSGSGIYQQRYDAEGRPKDGEQRVNTTRTGEQTLPEVTVLDDGGWVVVWISLFQDGSQGGIYQQRYNADGSLKDGEQRVNTVTEGHQGMPAVTALTDGGWVVTWVSPDGDGNGNGVYQQRYNANGSLRDDYRLVNTTFLGEQTAPAVTALKDGGWVVTWMFGTEGNSVLRQQRYNENGTPRGGEQQVNNSTPGPQKEPRVSALDDGGWIVTWTSFALDGSGTGNDIYQQRYNADGSPHGGALRVNASGQSEQSDADVAALENASGWVITWTSAGQDGAGTGIYQRHYTVVAAFGEGREFGTGTDGQDVFRVLNGGLGAGDSVDGSSGIDVLAMAGSGTLDLAAPDLLTGIEIVQGTGGGDVIVTNASRIAGLVGFAGGAGSDELHLAAGSYDFSSKFVSGIEAITLLGAGSITFADRATALLARSQTRDGAVTLTGDAFTLAERTQLYAQGIRKATDAGGVHILQPGNATLSQSTVQENMEAGTLVGELSTVDPNPADGLRLDLLDSADGRFALSGSRIVVADAALLDFEKGTAHTIVVRIADEGGITVDKTFTIDVSDAPTNTLRGNALSNQLTSTSGEDLLYGGLGRDTLTGGAGEDIFVFDTKPNAKTNRDTVSDFSVTDDAIWLDNAVFTKLGKVGSAAAPAALKSGFFAAGSKAKDRNDYIVYDSKKGVLSYDADGSGTKYKAVEIATLSKGLALKASDLFVV